MTEILDIFVGVFLAEVAATALYATVSTLRARKAEKAYYAKMEAFENAIAQRTETNTQA